MQEVTWEVYFDYSNHWYNDPEWNLLYHVQVEPI